MTELVDLFKIAVVILNYNSEQDLMRCTRQLAAQIGVRNTLILVDNASHPTSVEKISEWLAGWRPDAVIGTQSEVYAWIKKNPKEASAGGRIYFIKNHENRGYSAGNNIGIRVGEALGADAALIVNPDIQIEDNFYLLKLASKLMIGEDYVLAGSAIYNLDGNNENPMSELILIEEIFMPINAIMSFFRIRTPNSSLTGVHPCSQLSGSCFLIKISFLREIGYFDEGVFLYCEEAILASQVRQAGKMIAYLPEVKALHLHHSLTKGDRVKRVSRWVKSRDYYLQHYTEYNALSLFLLRLSHYAMLALTQLRAALPINPTTIIKK